MLSYCMIYGLGKRGIKMGKKTTVLRITLKSDLCVGSGYSYEGVVDTDICCNKNGIPYIPAKRIKGCLREAADLIRMSETEIAEIFGEGGADSVKGIQIENAFPEGYESLNDELNELKKSESEFMEILSQQNVLNHYSHVAAQTSIDENTGTAKQDTLRFTRVVNQYVDENEMSFLARVTFDCEEELLRKVIKAFRHIGMGRNRGFGNIRCSLGKIENISYPSLAEIPENENEKIYLKIVLNNVQPLMLSMGNDSKTEKYISGQSLLGALADSYILYKGYKNRENASSDEVFQDLFLNGTTLYSNLYIAKEKERKIKGKKTKEFVDYVPAPQFVKMLKKTKVFVNAAANISANDNGDTSYKNDEKYNTYGGNIPKKLNGKFVSIPKNYEKDHGIAIAEPLTEIIYHHSHGAVYDQGRSQEYENGILYAMEVLEEGQYFSGTILTLKKYEKLLKQLLEKPLYIGKSKTAQYGLCYEVGRECAQKYHSEFHAKKGDTIFVTLESDGIFIGTYDYTARYEEVRKVIADHLDIKYKKGDEGYSALESKIISGYHTMWNLKKPSIPAISAGSVFSYVLEEDCVITKEWIGEKKLEGFGKIRIYNAALLNATFDEQKEEKIDRWKPKASKELLKKILQEKLLTALQEKAFEQSDIGISAATLGRLTLMLEESLNLHSDCYRDAFEEFRKRVASIKRTKEKNKIFRCMETYLGGQAKGSILNEDDGKQMDISVSVMISGSDYAKQIYCMMKDVYEKTSEELDEDVKALWGKYFMQLLICQKYMKAEKRG